jgi:D-serine deaminase-like pyridoxal phosphate-dependent protein
MRLIGLAVLVGVSPLALADPGVEGGGRCAVSTPEQARSLADELYQQGAFQRAGECYQTAGDSERANLAFTKAVGPASAVTAQRAADQAERARGMAQRYKKALHLQE